MRKVSQGIVWVILAGGVAFAVSDGYAQDLERYERYFRELDRDNDDKLSTDEFKRMDGRYQERFAKVGFQPNRMITKAEYMELAAQVDANRQKEKEEEERARNRVDNSKAGMAAKGKAPARVTTDLPATFAPLDLNGDRQIGQYEWQRSRLADFVLLDRDGDGFLSPKELIPRAGETPIAPPPPLVIASAAGSAASTATPAAGPTPAANGSKGSSTDRNGRPNGSGSSRPAPAPPTPAAAAASSKPASPPPEDDKDRLLARRLFLGFDKDEDGQVSADEWAKSTGTRSKFEKAGMVLTPPLTEAVFVEQYLALLKKQKTSSSQ